MKKRSVAEGKYRGGWRLLFQKQERKRGEERKEGKEARQGEASLRADGLGGLLLLLHLLLDRLVALSLGAIALRPALLAEQLSQPRLHSVCVCVWHSIQFN